MSRSLTSSLPGRLFGPRESVGIALGRAGVCALLARRKANRLSVDWQGHRELPTPAMPGFQGAVAIGDVFRKVAGDIGERAKSLYLRVQVGLPDPLVQYANFEFDQLPRGGNALDSLIRRRFAREHHLDQQAISCVCQPLPGEQGRPVVLAGAVEKLLIGNIEQALSDSGMPVDRIDSMLAYKTRLLFGGGAVESSGAIISLEPDYWTIAIWDDGLNLRFIKSRWRQFGDIDREAEIQTVVAEAERIIRTYIHGDGDRKVERIYLSAGTDEATAFRDYINYRTREPAVQLEKLPAAAAIMGAANGGANAVSGTMLVLALPT